MFIMTRAGVLRLNKRCRRDLGYYRLDFKMLFRTSTGSEESEPLHLLPVGGAFCREAKERESAVVRKVAIAVVVFCAV